MQTLPANEPHRTPSGHLTLRRDLIVRPQTSNGARVFVVKDPVRGRFFRLKEIEFFIADRLDGVTDLATIRDVTEKQFGAPLPAATLEQFIYKLGQLGLLEAAVQAPAADAQGGRLRGSILYLRFKLLDPDRLLDHLARKLRVCFTPYFLIGSASLILFAVGLTIVDRAAIGRDFLRLYRFQALFLAWVTVMVVTAAHELAHGVTCKRFGGQVHEMGFLLVYFQPALYCNVSDAWLFRRKSERLWVSFAGAYCEMILWALATVTWRVTDPGTGLNYMALVVAATSAIKTLFNINPLIKLDGYYFLSDYLDIPNLRQRAFSYLGTQVKRVFRSAAQSTTGTSSRERWIYVTYGLLAFAYSFWLSGYVALWFGGLLVDRYQGWGFVLFSALLLAVFRRPLGRGFATLRVASGLKRVHPAGDQEAEGDPVPKPKRSAVTGAKIVAAAALVLAVLFFGRMPLTISGDFRILPRHNSDVRAEVEGIIEDIYVEEGDTVRPGQVIARLADRDYRAELREVTAQVEEKQAKLRLLKAGPRVEEIDRARASLEKTEERCKYASSQLSRLRPLFSQRLVSRQDLEEAEEEEAVRRKELEEAREQLRMLQAGSRPEEIEAAAAELSRLQTRQAYLREQLALLEVTSPIAGVVTTHKLKERVGRHVKRGTLIAKVHDLTTVTAEIAVPEKEISDVRLGQAVTLKARAYPFRRFDGTVASIAPIAHQEKEEEGRWGKTVLVTTQLDNPGLLLKAEMTGYAKIYSGKRRVLDVLTRRLTRYVRVEFWSWW